MLNFQYYTPTKVVFGKDAELKVGPLVKAEECKKSLSITEDRAQKDLGF